MDEQLDQAVVLLNQGRLQEGKDALERLDAENPNQATILYNLGMCYTELGFPDKAIAVLEKCVSIQPGFANDGETDSSRTCSVRWLTKDSVRIMMKADTWLEMGIVCRVTDSAESMSGFRMPKEENYEKTDRKVV